jgi:hypothetical protein
MDTFLMEDCVITGQYNNYATDGAGFGTDHGPGNPVGALNSTKNMTIQRNVFKNCHKGVQLYGADGPTNGCSGLFSHNTFIHCGRNFDLFHHGTITVKDNAGNTAGEAGYNLSDGGGNSAYTTLGTNDWAQTFDSNYFLVAGSSGINHASDGLDTGAKDT